MNNWKKSFLLLIVSFIISFGLGKLAVMGGYAGTYIITQTNNLIQINKIINNDTHKYIMSYNGKDYYVDKDYTYLYEIEQNGLTSSIAANSIVIDTDAEASLSNYFSEFYIIYNNEKFSVDPNVQIAISLPKNLQDNSIFVKIINEEKKVFYSYITLDVYTQIAMDMNIVSETFDVGNTKIYITKPSKIIDGTTANEENVSYKDGPTYIITSNNKVFLSEMTALVFTEKPGYYERINYFLYKDYMQEIETYKAEMEKMDPSSDDYKKLQEQTELLTSAMVGYYTELCYEISLPEKTIRIYRSYMKEGVLEEVPNMNIIEIEYSDRFVYGTTNLSWDDIKSSINPD
jgi:hypothetical protein